jgi:hypothetical protein
MTIDKINHYLGKDRVKFIASQSVDKLKEMKSNIINELEKIHDRSELAFLYNVELKFINYMLG